MTSNGDTVGDGAALAELFSKEWCEGAKLIWEDVVINNFADPENFNYIAEFGDSDSGNVCQFKAEQGKLQMFDPGKTYPPEECTFIFSGKTSAWQNVAQGKLDPVAAVASKRVHMQKGPMPIVIKEATAFKAFLIAWGRIPTAW